MSRKNTAQRRKILFVLNNYTRLKKHFGTEQNATVLVSFRQRGYEALEGVDITKGLKLADALINYYRIENGGVDRFIELYFFKGKSFIAAANALFISEKTARNWKAEVLDRAELIAAMLNF